MTKRLGGIIGCKDKTCSWHSIGFPGGSTIGSIVSYRGEAHRHTAHLHYINRHAGTPNKNEDKNTMSLDYSSINYIGSRIGWVSMKGIYES